MAASVWKVKSWNGRVYYYEDVKDFQRRLVSCMVQEIFEKKWHMRNSGTTPAWIRNVEGFRIENDVWVQQTVDADKLQAAVERRERRDFKASMRHRR